MCSEAEVCSTGKGFPDPQLTTITFRETRKVHPGECRSPPGVSKGMWGGEGGGCVHDNSGINRVFV